MLRELVDWISSKILVDIGRYISRLMKRMKEAQDELLRPHPLVQRSNVRISKRDIINGVLHVAENGCRRRALPRELGNWPTIYGRLRRRTASDAPDRLSMALLGHRLTRVRTDA